MTDLNPRNNMSYLDLLLKTISRDKLILKSGYKLIYTWETDFPEYEYLLTLEESKLKDKILEIYNNINCDNYNYNVIKDENSMNKDLIENSYDEDENSYDDSYDIDDEDSYEDSDDEYNNTAL